MTRRILAALALVTCVLAVATAATAQTPPLPKASPVAESRRMLAIQGQRYGTLADDDPMTVRVREVFGRILRAAGQRPGLILELYVLDTTRVMAESVRGGLVVLSRGFVDLTRGDDNALAFIIAHEAAHLLRDHHGILESLGVLGAGVATSGGANDQVVRAYRAMELDADRLGVLFTALAGYRAGAAVPLLVTLMERAGPDQFHPNSAERAAAIGTTIADVTDHVEVFHLGLFLIGAGRYLEAARVLEHFLALFPSREVLSAVGVAYHKEALRYAPPAQFRHLLVIDGATRAPSTKGTGGAHPSFRPLMDRAVHYYRLAVDADPGYAPARTNLGAAFLDLGDSSMALGHLNRAVTDDATLAAAFNNRGVVFATLRDQRAAESDWLTAARLAPNIREISLNLARLYEVQARADEAARWSARAGGDDAPAAPALERLGPLAPGAAATAVREWMGEPGVRQIAVPLGAGSADLALVIFSRRGLAVAMQSGVIDAVGILPAAGVSTSRGLRPGDPAARVTTLYGRAATIDGVQALSLLGYPSRALAVFVVKDRVQTVWFGRPRTAVEAMAK
ncbi:MAG: M48 family metalloprotease [Candidatus Rokubacteria bacterium]|nr:M48 family metalloprotease [Candidatus Rokubacteria bacterium]